VNLADWLLPGQGRLSPNDLTLLQRLTTILPESWRAGLYDPARHEQRALRRCQAISPRNWDLRFRSAKPYDALFAARLPAFESPANREFQSALSSCRLLVVLGENANASDPSRLLGEHALKSDFLRLYRGDFTDPLLRVDDYPTGVRPILEDLSSLHDVVARIDEAGLPFHLGVVPAILEERMVPFLRGLKNLVVSMHGFEHGYAKHAKILLEAGDPFNQRSTVGGFDEFKGYSYEEIEAKLREGRELLLSRLGHEPKSYIPPTNAANRRTGRALLATGFEYVLSERPIPGCELPCIGSDFYDRSSKFVPGSTPNVASLHATWEADLLRAGDRDSLQTFLGHLLEQRVRSRNQVFSLAERMVAELARG
jgi:hypothetical protein